MKAAPDLDALARELFGHPMADICFAHQCAVRAEDRARRLLKKHGVRRSGRNVSDEPLK